MDDFFTWETLLSYVNFISIVYMVVEFTKEMKRIKQIPTKYWSFFISFFLLICLHLANKDFYWKDIIPYLLTSISISLGTNGLSDFNNKNKKTKEK